MALSRLACLIAIATEVGHAAHKSPSVPTSRAWNAGGVDAVRVLSTTSYPSTSSGASYAYLLLCISVNATVRQGAYALVVRHK